MASHLTLQDREVLYRRKKAGKSKAEMVEALGRHRSTIYRELARNSGGRGYRPKQAQGLAEERRLDCRRKSKMSHPEFKKYVTKALKKQWSPDEIAGRSKQEFRRQPACQVSHQTIYHWLASEAPELRMHLRRGRRRSQPETQGQLIGGTRIEGRPKIVDSKRR